MLAFKTDFISMDSSVPLLTTRGEHILLKDLIKGQGKIVFYFGDQYCELCYQEILDLINNYLKETQTENIIVFAEYSNYRNLRYFLSNYNIQTEVYYISENLMLPAQTGKNPFFFIIDSNFKVQLVYIPNKKYLSKLNNYFELSNDLITKANEKIFGKRLIIK